MIEWPERLIGRMSNQETQSHPFPFSGSNSLQILPYRGYGTATRLHLMGRVLQGEGLETARIEAPLWENLLNMYKRFGTEVVPGARVQVCFEGQQQEVVTDRRGLFDVEISTNTALTGDRLWYDVQLELLEPQGNDRVPVQQTGRILIPSSAAKFGVISDIDDTIVYTYNNDWLRMLQIVYLGNAHTRIALPGISAFYQALHAGRSGQENNPFFYVSSSTWNLYDLLEEFLAINGLPTGPLLLRDLEFSLDNLLSFTHEQHKLSHIRPIIDGYPDLPFILVGDSGQRDAEIYHQLAREYPDRILAIYIRNVMPTDFAQRQRLNAIAAAVQHLGIKFVTVPDTLIAATHAVRQGWISEDALPGIQTDERADQLQQLA